jgi:hypothetical protein
MNSAQIRLETTEAGWRELADELSHRLTVVLPQKAAEPRTFYPMLALALAVLVMLLLPVAIWRRTAPPAPVEPAVVPVVRASPVRPPPPAVKRMHKKKHR